MTINVPLWLVLAGIVLCFGLATWTALAVWDLVRYVRTTGSSPQNWLRHPWRSRYSRPVLIRSVLTVVAVLLLFFTQRARPDNTLDATQPAPPEYTGPAPTKKQLEQESARRAQKLHQENQKAVDSPGIHYEPPKIDPEKHIEEILKRTKQRKETMK